MGRYLGDPAEKRDLYREAGKKGGEISSIPGYLGRYLGEPRDMLPSDAMLPSDVMLIYTGKLGKKGEKYPQY